MLIWITEIKQYLSSTFDDSHHDGIHVLAQLRAFGTYCANIRADAAEDLHKCIMYFVERTHMDFHIKTTWLLHIITIATAPGITACYFSLHKPGERLTRTYVHSIQSQFSARIYK